MKSKFFLLITLLLCALLAGCTLPTRQPDFTPDAAAAYTQAAQTLVAQLTLNAPPPLEAATTIPPAVPTDTETPAPTATIPPSETPLASATSTPAPLPTQPVSYAFFDNFEGYSSWYVAEDDDFSFAYAEDGYQISVAQLNAPVWSVRDQTFTDALLEVDARLSNGPQEAFYGLVCRHTEGGQDYYAFLVGPDGEYGIAKQENSEFEFLDQRSDDTGIIQRGGEVNRVRATCLGNSLELFVNGQKLMEVIDEDILEGTVGVIVMTRSQPDVEVIFDNFGIIE